MNKLRTITTIIFCEECKFTCKTKKHMERHRKMHAKKSVNKTLKGKLNINDTEDNTITGSYDLEEMVNISLKDDFEYSLGLNYLPMDEEFVSSNNVHTDDLPQVSNTPVERLFITGLQRNGFSFLENNVPNVSSGNFFILDSLKYKNYEDFVYQTGHFTMFCVLQDCSSTDIGLPLCFQPQEFINEIVTDIVFDALENPIEEEFKTFMYSSADVVNAGFDVEEEKGEDKIILEMKEGRYNELLERYDWETDCKLPEGS